jgi:hypothetical protein
LEPPITSPSHCPGTARSSTVAGLSLHSRRLARWASSGPSLCTVRTADLGGNEGARVERLAQPCWLSLTAGVGFSSPQLIYSMLIRTSAAFTRTRRWLYSSSGRVFLAVTFERCRATLMECKNPKNRNKSRQPLCGLFEQIVPTFLLCSLKSA